ncbi:formate/nitrite transporter family protein [Aureivirga sp. CE67]|uniref:formate/nitrite transporter family protein n=1 Tax=Aureivirga sp. CE67 TaxID=1788983 RepID=UPI0018CA0CCF|nr:formate/nitrite transporter family protein [Aureivirga sp. CE67]
MAKKESKKTTIDSSQKSHSDIIKEQVSEALIIYDKNNTSIFLSSLSAGLEIGFSYVLLCSMTHFFYTYFSDKVLWKINAMFYPIGFILVILGKSMLFTEQTSLLSLPVLNKKFKVRELIKIWLIVILGNLLGGFIMSGIAIWFGPKLDLFNKETIIFIAEHVSNYKLSTIFVSSILAGWLMGLLSWLLTSSDSTISRILIIYIITAVIGATGLHHSIVGNIEIFSGFLSTKDITIYKYLSFLITTIIGNAFGGVVFVALLKYKAFAYNGYN